MERPKSASLIWPRPSMRMFSGLMSLCKSYINNSYTEGGWEIPINESKLMDGFDGQNSSGHVELCNLFQECNMIGEQGKAISTRQVF